MSKATSWARPVGKQYGISVQVVYAVILGPFIIFGLFIIGLRHPATWSVTQTIIKTENYPVELATFILFLWGGLLGGWLARQTACHREGWFVTGFYVLVSLGLLLVAGEEVAWGQSFFHYQTPELLKPYNLQGEMTLHNIKGLQDNSEFMWASFGLAGFFGILCSSKVRTRKIGAPVILAPAFAFAIVIAGLGLYIQMYHSIQATVDYLVDYLGEVLEMVIALAGLLYIWLNGRRFAIEWAQPEQRQ